MRDVPKCQDENFVTLANFIADPLTIVDERGRFLVVNNAFEDLTGLKAKELIGTAFLEMTILSAESRMILLENLKKRMQGLPVEPYEINFTDKAGVTRYLEVKARKIEYAGKPADLVIFRDITRRKENARRLKEYSEKMEALVNEKVKEIKESAQKLRESEEKYRKQFEEAFDAIFVADAETGIIIDCNRAASELVGREKSELVGEHQRILHPSEEIEGESSRTFKQHLKEKEGQVLEAKVITKRGEIKDAAIKANVFELQGRKLVQGIFRDITEQKKAEEALKESEKKYRELINGMNDTAWVIDLNGNFVDVNDAAVKVLGYSREELLSMGPPDIDNSLTVEQIRDLVKRMPADQIQVFETAHTTKDGKTIPVEISSSLVTYQGKQAILSIARDITERKKAEEALRASEKYLEEILNSVLTGVVIVDEKTHQIVDANANALEVIGASKEHVVGKVCHCFVCPAEKGKCPISDLGQTVDGSERVLLRASGERIPILKTVTTTAWRGHKYLIESFIDITERKRLEEALQESEERFRQVAENALEWIWEVDSNGLYTYASSGVEKILGYKPEEIVGKKHFYDLFSPEDREELRKAAFKVFAQKQAFHGFINGNVHKEGKSVWLSTSGMPILDKKGNLLGYRGTDTDITERKQLEDDLRSSEEKFRAISASAMNAIILLDEKDRIVYWNPAAEKIFGYTTEEVLGKELGKLVVPPKNRKNHLALLERLVSSKEELSEKRVEIKALRKDGTEFPIELSATTLKLKDKTCVLEIVQDVSERKKLEAEMKQERDMLEAVTENIGAGLIIISKDYHTLWANGFIKRYKGDVEGKLCYATLNTLETICPQCGVKKVFEEGKAIDTHEYSSTDINGNSYTVELIATPIKDKDGKVVAALELAVDITEKKRMQSKLAEYSQKLEKLVEQKTDQLKQTQAKLVKSERLAAIGELAAMVGHDLRNPLTGIKGATYYLRSKCGASTDSRAKGMLKTIEECIDYSNKIVNDLLEYSTEMKLDLTETNAKTLIARSKSIVKYPANVRVVDVVDDEPTIMVDEAKMCRAFGNIIKNAIDAMPEGGTLTITSTKMEDELEIVFRDTGTGMSEETLDKLRLWVPLFTTKAKGMGFGLAICKRIMEAHGGKIRVESQLGKGTTVTVSFPLRPVVTSESEDKWIFSDASLSDAIKT